MPWWISPLAFYLVALLAFRWLGGLGAAAEMFRRLGTHQLRSDADSRLE